MVSDLTKLAFDKFLQRVSGKVNHERWRTDVEAEKFIEIVVAAFIEVTHGTGLTDDEFKACARKYSARAEATFGL